MVASSREDHGLRPRSILNEGIARVLIITAALVGYHNSFPGSFVFDDASSILENVSIRKLWPAGSVLSPPTEAGVAGRPLANLTFALNYALGGLSAGRFHAVNLGLHIVTALILFAVVRRTLSLPRLRPRFAATALPLATITAVLWVVHPLTTAVVNYNSQRTELLMALCYLLTLYAFIRSIETNSRIWTFVSIATCAAGMASKEVMITAPLLVWLYDRVFIAGSWRAALTARRGLYAGLAMTWLLLGWLVVTSRVAERGVGFELGIAWTDYALTQGRAVLRYLQLAIWPHDLVFDYGWDFVRTAGAGAFHVLAVLGLLTAALLALRRWPAAGFSACAVFLILAPTSSFIPIVQQPLAESRMYLPLAALLALFCGGAYSTLRGLSAVPLGLAAVVFTWLSIARNADYQSEIGLWSDTVAKRPLNARAHGNLSAALLRADRLPEAIAASEKATRLMPQYALARHNLALALARSGRVAEAIDHYQLALMKLPGSADTHYNLGDALVQTGRLDDALACFQRALQLNPQHSRAHNNLAVVLLDLGRAAESSEHARAALRIEPEFAEAHYNLGNALARMGDRAAAISSYREALRCRPGFARAHNNLGVLLLDAGDVAAAIRHFESAVKFDPAHSSARKNLELAKQRAR